MKLSQNAKNAIFMGTLCSVAYLAVYFARNILSAVTPQILETNALTQEYIGKVSSVYFICYAIGQLINGVLGDKIKAKYMVSFGLLLAGISNLVFSYGAQIPSVGLIAYGLTGFFLAMIYGPITKVVAENIEPIYVPRCTLGYVFASFFGTPLAGFVAVFTSWQGVFAISSVFLFVMAVLAFGFFLLFEKKGLIKYGQYNRPKERFSINNVWRGVKVLCQNGIVKFCFIAVITGVVRTTVVFWLPTYIAQELGFSASESASIFTVASLIISFTAFVAIFIYERLGRDMDKTILLMFFCAALFFTAVYFVKMPVLNIVLMVLAVMSSNCCASMLFSRYCPGLRDTGMVSTATGFLDCLSYIAASVSSTLFANAVGSLGWGNLILVWIGLMVVGIIVALPYKKIFSLRKEKETISPKTED